jgi:phospholipase C
MPGPTWPNRFFVHAASSGGLDHSPGALDMALSYRLRAFTFQHGHVFQRLEQHGVYWAVLSGGLVPQCFAMDGMHEFYFTDHRRSMGGMDALLDGLAQKDRAYVFIEPSYGDILNDTYKGGTSQHALDDVTRGEWLLKAVYEKLRASAIWDDCALLVTWDEHGGFWDHVTPPPATPPGDSTTNSANNKYGFRFDRHGVRVPALLISPRVQRNLIDHRVHDHSTVVAMLQELWPDLGGPFTARDGEQVTAHSTPAGLLDNDSRNDCTQTLAEPKPSDCPPDDDSPITGVGQIFGLAPVRTHVAADPAATPSDTTAGFAHIAHLIDANAVQPESQQQAATAFTNSVQSTGALASYLNDVQDRVAERLQPGQTERVQ